MADWHLEKTFSVGHIVTTLSFILVGLQYLTGLEKEIGTAAIERHHIQQNLSRIELQADKKTEKITTRFEEIRKEQKADSRRIEQKIDKLIDRELDGVKR